MSQRVFFRCGHMEAKVQWIVVPATARDGKAIAAKAKKLNIPISELMRRGAFVYESSSVADAMLGANADAAHRAIDFIDANNRRIAEMEAKVVIAPLGRPPAGGHRQDLDAHSRP